MMCMRMCVHTWDVVGTLYEVYMHAYVHTRAWHTVLCAPTCVRISRGKCPAEGEAAARLPAPELSLQKHSRQDHFK